MATKTIPRALRLQFVRKSNVISIEEWLRRKSMKEWQRRKATGERCWYPVRQKENGDWEFEPVYGVGEPICVYRERTDDPQIS
jgi:hypothetical protein